MITNVLFTDTHAYLKAAKAEVAEYMSTQPYNTAEYRMVRAADAAAVYLHRDHENIDPITFTCQLKDAFKTVIQNIPNMPASQEFIAHIQQLDYAILIERIIELYGMQHETAIIH